MDTKRIPGFENYTIDPNGNITHNRKGAKKWTINNCGYALVTLTHTDPKHRPRQSTFTVSKLVAMAYLPNPEGYKEVNHKDGNKLNNHVSNLEWCSRKDNIIHSVDNNLRKNLQPIICDGKYYPSRRRAIKETGASRYLLERLVEIQWNQPEDNDGNDLINIPVISLLNPAKQPG